MGCYIVNNANISGQQFKKGVQISSLVDVITIMALAKKSDRLIVGKEERSSEKESVGIVKILDTSDNLMLLGNKQWLPRQKQPVGQLLNPSLISQIAADAQHLTNLVQLM